MDGEWEPIETLPMDATPVLVFMPDADQPVSIVLANDLPCNKPTHWMRLPPPPSDLTITL